MKLKFFLLIASLILLASTTVQAENQFIRGKEWLILSQEEKATYVFNAIERFQKAGMYFSKSVKEYVQAIDNQLIDNPNLVSADATSIFASIVYDSEPETRDIFDRIVGPQVNK